MLHYMNLTLFFHFDCYPKPIQQSILLFLIFHVLVACLKPKHLHLIHKNFENHYILYLKTPCLHDRIQGLLNYNTKRNPLLHKQFLHLLNQHHQCLSFATLSSFIFIKFFNSSLVKPLYGFGTLLFTITG